MNWDLMVQSITHYQIPLILFVSICYDERSRERERERLSSFFFISDEVGLSIYPLPVYCNRTGFYKAFYEDVNNTCIYSCLFLVEVEEVRNDVLEQEFSAYRTFLVQVLVIALC